MIEIAKELAQEVLDAALASGADFAELYAEDTRQNRISMVDSGIDAVQDQRKAGAGVRILKGTRSVYASTALLTREGLLACAKRVADTLDSVRENDGIRLDERIFGDVHPIRIVPSSVQGARKADLLREACYAAREYHEEISQVQGSILDVDRRILIANSEGLYTTDRQIRTRISVNAVASGGGENQSGYYAPGRRMGLEMFELISPKEVGRKAARQAVTMLHAGYCPAGKMTVAIENGFGGVIFHEACGHSLEASAVSMGQSQFAGKLGQQIANSKLTAIDDGTIPNAWGSMNIDDEGVPAQKKILIENGILKSYMVDRLNGRRMGLPSTGSGRRQDYTFDPTSRMTNTYIANGPDRNEDIIASIEYGLYAKSMGGGSVNPVTGEFNFAVTEGYLIRGGRIAEPVRGASLIGKGSEVLMNIDMIGQNLMTAQGMCGAASGSIPTDVGQPLIRVSSITVGGR